MRIEIPADVPVPCMSIPSTESNGEDNVQGDTEMLDVPANDDDEGMATVATEQKSVTLEQCISAQLRPIDIATDTTVNSDSEGSKCVKCTQWRVGRG